VKVFLADLNANIGRKDILKPVGNESLCEIWNDNGV
jgi:hypothetical protein